MADSLAPDIILTNGLVQTMDAHQPRAEAVAILGSRIGAVGSNKEISALAGSHTRVIDAEQGTVLPGFNDAHVHFLAGGFSLSNVDLRDARSPQELSERLAQYARHVPLGEWIQGGEWDHENWVEDRSSSRTAVIGQRNTLPNRGVVDPATPSHPILITRFDGHMALANSLALRLAGVTRETKDPAGGVVVRDPKTGEPTGLLKDSAQSLVERIIPPKSAAQKRAALLAATRHAAACGVTSVTDVSTDDDFSLYQEMVTQGQIQTRIYAARSIATFETLVKAGVRAAFGNDLLRIGILKGFSDGSLGSSTARFFEPYDDEPGNRGLWFDQMFPEGIMDQRVGAADRAGLQVMIHAIGDEANQRILDLYRQVASTNGERDRRFRIEHAQHLREPDILRFGGQKVVASVQPYHAADDGRWCEKRIGKQRCQAAYPFRSLLAAGAVLAFGSDWTVAPLNPLLGIKAAVTRQTLDGHNPEGWIPEQRISLQEALSAYTHGSAFAEFSEEVKGSLSPGKLADIVVLDRDIDRQPGSELDRGTPRMTILGGTVVYERSA